MVSNESSEKVKDTLADAAYQIPVKKESWHEGVVLIVDNESDIIKSLRRLLRDDPYKVLGAGSALEALTVLAKTKVHVALLDYKLNGGRDGLWLARLIGAQFPGTVRIMMSGFWDTELVNSAVKKGEIFRYLVKPWDEKEFKQTLSMAMKTALELSGEGRSPIIAGVAAVLDLIGLAPEAGGALRAGAGGMEWVERMIELSKAVESRDPYTLGHSSRVAMLSIWMGEWLGLSGQELWEIKVGSLMHDVGKVIIPDSILFKASSLLSEEWAVIKDHTLRGYQVLLENGVPEKIAAVALEHHENYDGSGYPRKIAGKNISLFARIVRLADTFDAMHQNRPYRLSLPLETIMENLRELSGSQFDPDLAGGFLQVIQTKIPSSSPTVS